MDFRPSAPQQLLVSTARQFLGARCPIELVQRLALDERGFDEALWRGMAELGWQGLLVPAELGGSGCSLLDVVLLVEEMGRACVPGPFIPSAVAATSALAAADPSLQKRTLPAMADGARIITLALVEEGVSFDPDAVTLTSDVPGHLTGRKLFVEDAHLADDLLVAVRSADDLTLVLVPTDRAGVTRVPLDTAGTGRLFEVIFDGVAVGVDDVVGAPGHGRAPLVRALRTGALTRAAEIVGAAQRVLELTVEHAKTRVQGGRPIGGHQAIQHACADLVRDVDASRGLLYAAAWKAAEGEAPEGDIAMAKAYAGEAGLQVARRGHQILGAIGYCEEHPMHLFHKRILAASLDFGDADLHLETVAQASGWRRWPYRRSLSLAPSMRQDRGEAIRDVPRKSQRTQVRHGSLDVVRRPLQRHHAIVDQRIARARIAVARLADASGIDHELAADPTAHGKVHVPEEHVVLVDRTDLVPQIVLGAVRHQSVTIQVIERGRVDAEEAVSGRRERRRQRQDTEEVEVFWPQQGSMQRPGGLGERLARRRAPAVDGVHQGAS